MKEYQKKLLELIRKNNLKLYEEKRKFYEKKKTAPYEEKPKHLYQMGGKPYSGVLPKGFLPKETTIRNTSLGNSVSSNSARYTTYIFIDAENISASKYKQVREVVEEKFTERDVEYRAYYVKGHGNSWEKMENDKNFKKMPLPGRAGNNKVDNHIKKEIHDKIENEKAIIYLVSSDAGYKDIVNEIKKKRLKVYGIGEKKTPEHYRKVFVSFSVLD